MDSDPRYRPHRRPPLGLSFSALMEKKNRTTGLDGLSPRERQILTLVVEGKTSKEIADIIGVKPASVDTYRGRIMTKLGANSVVELVRFAVRVGLINP